MNEFLDLLSDSIGELKSHFLTYFPFIIIYFLLGLVPPFFTMAGLPLEEMFGFFVRLLLSSLTIMNSVFVLKLVVLEREGKRVGPLSEFLWDGFCDTPTYFLYSLIYGLRVMAWALLLFLPGVYFSITYFLVPTISIIDPEVEEGYFKRSHHLVSRNMAPMVLFFVLSGIFYFLYSPVFLIENTGLRLSYEFFFVLPESFYTLIADIFLVKLYFHLKEKEGGESFRPNVAVFIRDESGNILFGRRRGEPHYQVPQGGREPGETAEETLKREIKEETCMENFKIIFRAPEKLRYRFLSRGSVNPYVGQEQTWFLVEIEESEKAKLAPTEEFEEFSWLPIEQILEQVIDFKKEVYQKAYQQFRLSGHFGEDA